MSVDKDIRQKRPFTGPTHEAAVALMLTADLVRRAVAQVVGAEGITPQQYNVLRILRGAGSEGLPTLEIAERMIEQTPGITRLIDRLEAKKLVARRRCLTDRRQVFCIIADAGLKALARLDEPITTVQEQALSALTERQLADLLKLLDIARKGLNVTLAAVRGDNKVEAS